MISIRKNVSELDRCHQARELALDCYVNALRNAAHYAVELEEALTPPYRGYLNTLVAEADLVDSRATVRGLFRNYRDKAAEHLAKLRDELAGTARAMQEIMESLSQSDGDHEAQLRSAVGKLRSLSRSAESLSLRDSISAATATIEQSLEQIRKQHQITVSGFLTEIRMLHKRIDALEAAACIDNVTRLFNRREIEGRIRSLSSGAYCLLLVRLNGLRMAAANFSPEVSAELAAAFTKRLRNSLPEHAVIGRWRDEDFVAILHTPKTDAINAGKFVAEHLGGPYACIQNGKTVRPSLQLLLGMVDSNGDKPERILERVEEFLPER